MRSPCPPTERDDEDRLTIGEKRGDIVPRSPASEKTATINSKKFVGSSKYLLGRVVVLCCLHLACTFHHDENVLDAGKSISIYFNDVLVLTLLEKVQSRREWDLLHARFKMHPLGHPSKNLSPCSRPTKKQIMYEGVERRAKSWSVHCFINPCKHLSKVHGSKIFLLQVHCWEFGHSATSLAG